MKKDSKKSITIDELAQMVALGFQDMGNKFKNVDDRMDLLEERLVSRINGLENRIDDLVLNRVKYEDLVPIKIRIDKIEQKMKV